MNMIDHFLKKIIISLLFLFCLCPSHQHVIAQTQERGTTNNRMLFNYLHQNTPVTEVKSSIDVTVMNKDTPLHGTGFLSELDDITVRVSSQDFVIPNYTVKAKILRRGMVFDEKEFRDDAKLSASFFRWIKSVPIKDESFNVIFLIVFDDPSIPEKTYVLRVKPF